MIKIDKAPALLALTFRSGRQRVRWARCQMVITAEEKNKAGAGGRAWAVGGGGVVGREDSLVPVGDI